MHLPEGDEGSRLTDVALLGAILAASCALYFHGLGFYSDDWPFLASLSRFGDHAHVGRPEIIDWAAYLDPRPVQIVYQKVLFSLFGMQPLGYHVVNSAVLVAGGIMFYLSLARIGVSRAVAFAVPAVYGLLPHYSTARFWFAAFGFALAILCCFVHLYANLRAGTEPRKSLILWKSIGLAAAALAAFGYEIALPLLAANVLIVSWYRRRRVTIATHPFAHWLPDAAVLIAAVMYKMSIPGGIESPQDPIMHLVRLVAGSVTISFGSYGLGIFETARWGIAVAGIPTLITAGAVAVVVYVHMMRCTAASWVNPRGAIRLGAAGIVVFLLGYSVFILTTRVYFTSTGISNRIAIAGTLGVAMVIVATAFLVAHTWSSMRARRAMLSTLVAGVCAVGLVVTTGLADRWAQSWEREQEVLAAMSDVRIPPGASVLLQGVCPYVGPAPVFESNWDLTGALEIIYNDSGIHADVTTTVDSFGPDTITTEIYGSIRASYPYGRNLLLVEHPEGRTTILSSRRVAVEAIGEEPPFPDNCERGIAGAGQTLFSIDRLYRDFENRYLWR